MPGLDTFTLEYAAALRDCLETELNLRPPAPAETCLIYGEEGRSFLSVGLSQDRCCAGFAWVRLAGVTPKLPSDPRKIERCGVSTWQVDYEMGVARCAPFGDEQQDAGCAVWAPLVAQEHSDMAAMFAALCCWRPQIASKVVVPTGWLPFGADGGCQGGIMGVSVQLDNCGC